MLHELIHIAWSILAGYIAWSVYGKKKHTLVPALIWALVGGFWIDLDHLIDYFLTFGVLFDLSRFLQSEQFVVSGKTYVLFHAWEYLFILLGALFFVKKQKTKTVLLALLLGTLSHLVIDTLSYSFPIAYYSILYRILDGFGAPRL